MLNFCLESFKMVMIFEYGIHFHGMKDIQNEFVVCQYLHCLRILRCMTLGSM